MFGLQVAAVPTNKPSRRVDHPAKLFFSKEQKLQVGALGRPGAQVVAECTESRRGGGGAATAAAA